MSIAAATFSFYTFDNLGKFIDHSTMWRMLLHIQEELIRLRSRVADYIIFFAMFKLFIKSAKLWTKPVRITFSGFFKKVVVGTN
jgi:hypothetical protein